MSEQDFSPATSIHPLFGQPGVTMTNEFEEACLYIKSKIPQSYHSSLDTPQMALGGITPYQHLRRGGDRQTIISMFQPGNGG